MSTGLEEEKVVPVNEMLENIEAVLGKLEDPSLPLEEGMELFKRGMALVRSCQERLGTIEKKMLEISEDGTYHEFPG